MTGDDYLQRWPCRSSHRLTVSLDGVKPLTITLPYPILPDTFKATQKDGIVEVVAAKALNDIWPEDVMRHQFRLNADKFNLWTDKEAILTHLMSQFRFGIVVNTQTALRDAVLNEVRTVIQGIFTLALENQPFFQLQIEGPLETEEWLIRAHLPIRTSPGGAPVLLLSALDLRHLKELESRGNLIQGNSSMVDPTDVQVFDSKRLRPSAHLVEQK